MGNSTWKKAKLAEGIKLLSGQHIQATDYTDEPPGTPYLTGPADFPGGRIVLTKWTAKPKVVCSTGDLLLTVKGSGTGKMTQADAAYCISRQLMAIRPTRWDPGFVYYSLDAVVGSLRRQAQGFIPGISRTDILDREIDFPPLPEQRKIAAILSSVDEAIEKTQAVIDQVQVVKKGLMQELLTRGLPGRHTRFKQTEIGEVPQEWDITTVGQSGNWFSGGTPSKQNAAYWSGEIPWVSPKDMKRLRISDAIDHVSEEAVGNGTRRMPSGSVLVVVRGMILAHSFPVAITEVPVTFNQDMKALTVSNKFDPEYVLYWLVLQAPHFVRLISTATHGTKRLTSEALFESLIPCPTRSEQVAICDVFRANDDYLERLESKVEGLQTLKTGLMSVLLTGEVRVQPEENAS